MLRPEIVTSQGSKIESASCYRYFGILIDESFFYSGYSSAGKKVETGFLFQYQILPESKKRLLLLLC